MLAVSVYVCLPLCENVLSTSLQIAIQNYSVLEDLPCFDFWFSFFFFGWSSFVSHFEFTKHHCPPRTKKGNSQLLVVLFYIQCF